ncbi:hypothetical protein [Candidatus Mycobacterium methanotrophicum]|uniref:Uncharacterized protein n=1 Tax=Candidatus Mycobacterium methanotrophicum TaxID=2943498 RepID=A0ABY4QU33_9MYCO|nr:hypothetical protein [Candidatus Mycobacterium methanotrophicum]UQX13473.1 hypothetical protein M5I08_25040 [Candidatus Mycobacterium methanotrophicum]
MGEAARFTIDGMPTPMRLGRSGPAIRAFLNRWRRQTWSVARVAADDDTVHAHTN